MNEIKFNDIYENYADIVLKAAFYYSKNLSIAEDITQLAFAKLYISYDDIANKNAVGSWLITAVRYLAYSHARKMKKETLIGCDEVEDCMDEREKGAEEVIFMKYQEKERNDFTDNLLEELYQYNPKWYEGVIKAYVLEIPQKEIANEMGIRLEALQAMLYRAKKWIKRKYEADYREIK
nr:RNA polymerase sigma factor [uncultured Sellimonas sp.]